MIGPCAKTQVRCVIITESGNAYHGENLCAAPQEKCPRHPGEGYIKCRSICRQIGHAEQVALALARHDKGLKGSTAFLSGHTYACQDCQEALYSAGVKYISVVSQ